MRLALTPVCLPNHLSCHTNIYTSLDPIMKIRKTEEKDIPSLKYILDGLDLFPSEMLPSMVGGFLAGDYLDSIWITCEVDDGPIGFCYAVPEQLAEGTWNMLAIGVHTSNQRKGAGAKLVKHLEEMLRDRGQRILIADTSSGDDYAKTRAFYRENSYIEEARVRDFWAEGDDKITFWKQLSSQNT